MPIIQVQVIITFSLIPTFRVQLDGPLDSLHWAATYTRLDIPAGDGDFALILNSAQCEVENAFILTAMCSELALILRITVYSWLEY